MEKSSVIKTVSGVLMLLGIVTAGVCIWLIADPIKVGIGFAQSSLDGGHSPKIGIAAAVLMIVVGISFCLINSEGRFNFFAGALVVILALSIASMSVAIKDHQDSNKASAIVENLKNINPSFEIKLDSWKAIDNIDIKNPSDDILKINDKMMTRLKAVAAVGGIDSIAMIICLGVLFKYRN